MGIELNRESASDATTLLNFRHLLESHKLPESIFNTITGNLAEKGLLPRKGTFPVSYTLLQPHETVLDLHCRLLLEKKQNNNSDLTNYSSTKTHKTTLTKLSMEVI